MKKKSQKYSMLKGEKMICILILITLIVFPISTVFTKAILSETNISVEQLKSKIDNQEEVNESLSVQVDELASLDKIQKVAIEKGMSYNNNNIKNINE